MSNLWYVSSAVLASRVASCARTLGFPSGSSSPSLGLLGSLLTSSIECSGGF